MSKNIIFLPLALFIAQITIASQSSHIEQPELQLHFDINKTIIAMDAAQGKDLTTTINGILAEFTFAKWDGEHEQSYYAYITDQIAQECPHLSRTADEFKHIRSERLKNFSDDLKKQPALFTAYEADKAKMLKILSSDKPVIFPSFYKAITWLNDKYSPKYRIYLRTFGQDLPEVVPAIEQHTTLKFTYGIFQGTKLSIPAASSSPIHYAIQDDYLYWKSKGFQAIGGKPFPIDLNNPRVISIFFDDNANDQAKPIIKPMGHDGHIEDTEMLLRRGNIVAVNPKEAILDEDYFIKKIKALLPLS